MRIQVIEKQTTDRISSATDRKSQAYNLSKNRQLIEYEQLIDKDIKHN